MYGVTYPYWIEQYKHYGSYAAGFGLIAEMNPLDNKFLKALPTMKKIKIILFYIASSTGGIVVPYRIFSQLQPRLHRIVRK
jgi:hypothetical protein